MQLLHDTAKAVRLAGAMTCPQLRLSIHAMSRIQVIKLVFTFISALHLFTCFFWRIKKDTFSPVCEQSNAVLAACSLGKPLQPQTIIYISQSSQCFEPCSFFVDRVHSLLSEIPANVQNTPTKYAHTGCLPSCNASWHSHGLDCHHRLQ